MALQILFVHGMGRTPLSGAALFLRCRKNDIKASTFGYVTALQTFATIHDRLVKRIVEMASQGEYILVRHSLGGVLIRSALSELPPATKLPQHVFLLGSPIAASRMAKKLHRQWLYRVMTGDCGQLLASDQRMAKIAALAIPTSSIVGTKRINGKYSPFLDEANDGVVAVSELSANWIKEEIRVPVIHTLLPASRLVSDLILRIVKRNH